MRVLTRWFVGASILALLIAHCGTQAQSAQPTIVNVSSTVANTGVKRFGLNLGTQTYWDSGMMLKNLVSRNPGFEGEMWQSILHCSTATTTRCTDDNGYSAWPANFFSGATGEWITGNLTGSTVTISSSTVAGNTQGAGISVTYPAMTQAPASGDYLVVRMNVPGNAPAGWWPYTVNGATITTELSDLSPNSPGKQALRLSATGSTQSAAISSYLDTTGTRSFLQMHGAYTLSFRAKGMGGSNTMVVGLKRTPASGAASITFFSQSVVLTTAWQDYTYTFNTNDTGALGGIVLSFQTTAASALLDDVSLVPASTGVVNDTAFRDEVVAMLYNVHPGILRYMDSGTNWGSSIDNLLAVPFARQRAGYSNWNTESDDIPIGLPEFLTLCEQIGSEPWFTMPTGMETAEMTNLMEYLGGSTSTVYGALRATLGHPMPWTSTFSRIHLEFGNEVWNTANPGATMTDATGYATRMNLIFKTARSSPWYSSTIYDLVGNGWAALPYFTQNVLSTGTQLDTIDVAPYLFYSFKDASSNEAIFGPMFAQPELLDSVAGGEMQQQAAAASSAGKKLSLYEVNLSATSGTVSQSAINTTVPSLGAGLATIDHMLLMLRDLGITEQNLFALPGYNNYFSGSTTGMTTPLWGSVVDMGNTNRMRPALVAESLANTALMPMMLKTTQTGANPVWNQALSSNDNIALNGAHYLQSFAFTDGSKASLILLNLHRTSALPVVLSGTWAPTGAVSMSTMAASAITATNEDAANVTVSTQSLTLNTGAQLSLAPYTMTVLTWQLRPVTMTTVTCADNPVALNGVTQCTSDIAITNGASPAVTWSASVGSISSTGIYVAPATLPANNQATITATSVQDTTQTASITLTVATPGATAISLNCGSTSIAINTQATCVPTVTGVGTFNNAVTWTTTAGIINAAGTFTAPARTGTAVITATSQANPAITASVTLTIVPQSLAISSVRLTNITATSITVSWNAGISTANSGVNYGLTTSYGQTTPWISTLTANPTFTLTGLTPNTTYYIAPYSVAGGKTVTSTFTVTTPPAATISPITCSGSTVYTGSTDACTATMSDASAIAWTASLGSISSAGVYTPPSTLSAATSVTITATSVNSSTTSATFAITAVPSVVSSVSASCTPSTLIVSTQTQCAAIVNGTGNYSSSVKWTTSAGTISSTGLLTAPATPTTVTVTAVSTMNPQISGTAQTTVNPVPAVTAIAVTCTPSTLTVSTQTQCAATVSGRGNYSSSVNWTTSAGTISSTGLLTAPATPTTVTVTAVSTMNPQISGAAQATVNPILAISNIQATNITSSSVTISWNAGLSTANSGISYGPTLSYGTVSAWIPTLTATPSFTLTGLKGGTTYYLLVYSKAAGTTVTSTFQVTTAPAPTISPITCSGSTVYTGSTDACTATMSDASAVAWTASLGSISSAGVYTPPSTLSAATSVTITATSVNSSTTSATFAITAVPSVVSSVSASCTSSTLIVSTQTQCAAIVSGIGNYSSSVKWTTSAGTISSTGLLTAPATPTTVTVTAVSTMNPQISGAAQATVNPILAISNIQATNITSSSVTISWNAGLSTANSGISYGPTLSYGTVTAWTPTLTATPSFTLTGLKGGTTYYLLVYSKAAGTTVTSTFQVTTAGPATISPITCAGSTVYTGSTDACTATMSDASAIAWTASLGSISSAGVYTPPSTLSAATSVTITATSVNSSTTTATFAITAVPSVVSSVSASCTPSTLTVSTQTQCAATVAGTGNFNPSVNSMSSTGLLTAPASPAATVNPIPAISNIQATNITSSSVTISWNAGLSTANSGISYGPTLTYGKVTAWIPTLTATPSFTLTGLNADTVYYLLVYSKAAGTTVTTKFKVTTAR